MKETFKINDYKKSKNTKVPISKRKLKRKYKFGANEDIRVESNEFSDSQKSNKGLDIRELILRENSNKMNILEEEKRSSFKNSYYNVSLLVY